MCTNSPHLPWFMRTDRVPKPRPFRIFPFLLKRPIEHTPKTRCDRSLCLSHCYSCRRRGRDPIVGSGSLSPQLRYTCNMTVSEVVEKTSPSLVKATEKYSAVRIDERYLRLRVLLDHIFDSDFHLGQSAPIFTCGSRTCLRAINKSMHLLPRQDV